MPFSLYRLFILFAVVFTLSACTTLRGIATDGLVDEDYGKRTLGTSIEDRDIESKTSINLKHTLGDNNNNNIQVKSYNRIVLLTGQVANNNTKQQAAQIAQAIRNVRSVHNELEVGATANFSQRSKDSLLATKVRTRLLANADIESSRIEMVVENSVIYFMGLVTKAEATRVIEAAQQSSGIKKIVKVFEYIEPKQSE